MLIIFGAEKRDDVNTQKNKIQEYNYVTFLFKRLLNSNFWPFSFELNKKYIF